jgi:hypothetical protein
MEIKIPTKIEVNAKTMKIHLKCRDQFQFEIVDDKDNVIFEQEDGYVPGFMPGQHYGDYLILDIDLDSGKITNWEASPEEVEELFKERT